MLTWLWSHHHSYHPLKDCQPQVFIWEGAQVTLQSWHSDSKHYSCYTRTGTCFPPSPFCCFSSCVMVSSTSKQQQQQYLPADKCANVKCHTTVSSDLQLAEFTITIIFFEYWVTCTAVFSYCEWLKIFRYNLCFTIFIAVYYPPCIFSLSSHLLSLIIRCVPHIYDSGSYEVTGTCRFYF